MRPWFETVEDLATGAEAIRAHRYGVIDVVEGRLARICLRPYPKFVTLCDALWLGRWIHDRKLGDRCRLFFNQPRRHPRYLALKYAISTRDCSFASLRAALGVLDEVARIKGADALLTDAANGRISDRFMRRFGWEPHCPSRWHRHYIKRFYGHYPPPPAARFPVRPPSIIMDTRHFGGEVPVEAC